MDKDKASVHDMSETEYQHAKRGHGGKGSGSKSRRTRRRQELLAEQERHAMDKPKPLEEVSDGDLTEIKKDPVWKTWLEKETGYTDSKGKKHKPSETQHHQVHTRKRERDRKTEMWRDLTEGGAIIQKINNITKPIPDSKGGRGSFQHCINANQDKHNPGGWCKQIERKIGKGLGALGEGKLNRKTGKPMKLNRCH